jgi:UDP-N-acetylmuramate: L-alanyl-gamma-D-glutamyl-meso-diaminopimelate ligase
MRSGVHKDRILSSLQNADMVVCKSTELDWGLKTILTQCTQPTALYDDVDTLVSHLVPKLNPGDHVVIMSNSGFGNIHQKLLDAISAEHYPEVK